MDDERSHPAVGAVTFDVDGTLYDPGPHLVRVGWRLLPHLGLLRRWKTAVESCRGAAGDPATEVLARLGRTTGIPEEELARRMEACLHTWADQLRPRDVLPGVREALDLLDRLGIPRAVASDHPPGRKLRALGLHQGWSAEADGTSAGALKPHPAVLHAAAAALGIPPRHLLHVGDRDDTDGEAARRAGAGFLRVGPGHTRDLAARLQGVLARAGRVAS